MHKNLTLIAFLGAVSILLGAFGAHALKESLTADALKSFETAVRYQMYHVIVLLIINLTSHFSETIKKRITLIFILGILFFSGSIYAIYLLNIPVKYIWFITPIGGLVLFLGWMQICYQFYKKTRKK